MFDHPPSPRRTRQLLTRLWSILVEPPARIQDEYQRYRSRLLTSFLVVLTLVFAALAPMALLVKPGTPWTDREFVLMWLTLLVLAVLCGFSRYGNYKLVAAILTVYGGFAICYQAFVIGGQIGLQILDFLIIPVAFATIFISFRAALVVCVFQFVGIMITLLAMNVGVELASYPVRFYLVACGLFVIGMFYKRRMDQARETQLAISNANYRAFVESAQDLVYTVSPTGEMISLNPAFETITGWPLNELIGRSFSDFIDPDYATLADAFFQATLSGEKIGPCELRIRIRSGDYLWIEYNNATIEQDGKIIAVAGLARVIEERKQLEAALLHSEELYRTLIHHFPDGAVFLFNRDLRYQIVDGQALGSLGLEKEQLEGRTIWKALPPDLVYIFEPIYRATLAGNVSVHEFSFGERIYRVQTVPVSDDRGAIVAGMAVGQDITSWRSAEDRFRAVFEYSPDAILLVDPETATIVDCNDVAGQMTGYTRDELIGQPMQALNAGVPTDSVGYSRNIRNLNISRYEAVRRRKNGTVFPVEVTTTLIQVAGKQLLLALDRDITLRKQAEAERLQLALEHERLAMLGQFVQAISHEFRNTLSLVETGRYLIERSLPENVRQPIMPKLSSIQESVARLNDQLNNLNTISSLSNLHYSSCDLNELVESLVTEHTPRARQKNQQMEFEPFACLSPIQVDTDILRQAIKQLIINAQNFTPDGGVIRLHTCEVEKQVQVCIEDTGIGISPEHLPHVFDLFYRVDPARQVDSGGVGIGLSIARMIAEAHCGYVQVESTPGQGSTFTLSIPAGQRDT